MRKALKKYRGAREALDRVPPGTAWVHGLLDACADARRGLCPDCLAALAEPDQYAPESTREWFEAGHHVCGRKP